MILDLVTVKDFLKVEQDFHDEDNIIQLLINASESYLYNATGIQFDDNYPTARLFCLILVADWYDNRQMVGKISEKVRYTVESMITQLKYCYGGDAP
ncbi:head-tail connector protein [Desulfitobacterium sp. PCE1]|uniref:head-tail connector protein n=1 Tax=Desulfitobacterium sp. PCE1 TaxID=146907 RepID=UPI000360E8C1|nr:head-tail connector protein [Desulfitobacterium sp. PCE1]